MLARILYYYAYHRYLGRYLISSSRLKHHQATQFNRLKKQALIRSPFYKPFLNKPFTEWPMMDKQTLMAHFDEINTLGIKKEHALEIALKAEASRDFSPLIQDTAVGLSSGTSGNRGLFLASSRERDIWASLILAKAMPNGIWGKERIAFFLRANNQLYTTLNKNKKIEFHFFDLLQELESHFDRLNRLQPTILSAPASVLRLLAHYKRRLNIAPKKIISVAEVLEADDETLIKEAFKQPVSQIYQCTEGLLALSDRFSNRLLMNDEFLIIEKEWLDEKRFIPIITDLYRSTQPIIRYRLDDVLIHKPSENVFTELQGIEGRQGDVCYGVQNNHKKIPLFADVIRQHMAQCLVEFEDYGIIQTTKDEFILQIAPESLDKQKLIHHLNELFERYHCSKPNWVFQPLPSRALTAKRRRIISSWNHE
ncbi:F390 synthetase-related protein [Legionella impletisoli]|uniref:Coenzyme F390 synthetase n=1 Tax=Legionella impletisoli TaxID=343510 RepID=A0A917NC07_9GAMM|nr:F390 synthetase-related protein [Legionella impletisoli]GGI82314.1 coenzyme F390 synthetase [Legionella impletisoli]